MSHERAPSHRSQILTLLKQKPMTTLELQQETGILRVQARISELREEGWQISTEEGYDGSALYLLTSDRRQDRRKKLAGLTVKLFETSDRWEISIHQNSGEGCEKALGDLQLAALRTAVLEACERWHYETLGDVEVILPIDDDYSLSDLMSDSELC